MVVSRLSGNFPLKGTGRALVTYRPMALSRQFGRRFVLDHMLPCTGRAAARDYSFAGMVARRSLYVHVPKAAGVSVLKVLSGNAGMGHMSIREYQGVLRAGYMARATVMTTVRNSFDRVHSAYIFLKAGGWPGTRDEDFQRTLAPCASFEHFLLDWLERDDVQAMEHFRPTLDYLCDADGELFPFTFMARFERLEEDFAQMAHLIGAPAVLPRLNMRPPQQAADYRKVYTPAMVDAVERVYGPSIAALGYTFDGYSETIPALEQARRKKAKARA